MSAYIGFQLHFFLVSIWSGVILFFLYDQLRILRRILSHTVFWIAIEDVVFWIFSAIFIFQMMYQQNEGFIRWFSIFGMMIGMGLYYILLSKKLIGFATNIAKKLISFLIWPIHQWRSKIRWIRKKINEKRDCKEVRGEKK